MVWKRQWVQKVNLQQAFQSFYTNWHVTLAVCALNAARLHSSYNRGCVKVQRALLFCRLANSPKAVIIGEWRTSLHSPEQWRFSLFFHNEGHSKLLSTSGAAVTKFSLYSLCFHGYGSWKAEKAANLHNLYTDIMSVIASCVSDSSIIPIWVP